MCAANDGADADSKIAAAVKSLMFITVLVVLPVTSFRFGFGSELYTACGRLQPPTPRNPDFLSTLCQANQVRDAPRTFAPRTLAMVIAVIAFRSAARWASSRSLACYSTSKSISASLFGSSTASASNFR
jgi:hypothetical protein